MGKKDSKRVVVDASVARAASEASVNPPGSTCRRVLETIRNVHRLVMTPDIRDEWEKHASRYARLWRVSMDARRRVDRPVGVERPELRAKLDELPSRWLPPSSYPEDSDRGRERENQREIMLKDARLLEAALATDRLVVSLDVEVERLFKRAATSIKEIKTVAWLDPHVADEVTWLADGADPDACSCRLEPLEE